MKICITLDDVIRAKTAQIGKVYKKYVNPEIDLDALDFSSGIYSEIFGFDDDRDWKEFLYDTYSYEIFAEASMMEKSLDKKLNLWHIHMSDDDRDEPIELMLANPLEFNNSIGYTFFFLSKMATRIRDVYFPTDSATIWDRCDVVISTNPYLLSQKPDGKIAIKINMPYNKDVKADYIYDSLSEFLDNENKVDELIEKLNND